VEKELQGGALGRKVEVLIERTSSGVNLKRA